MASYDGAEVKTPSSFTSENASKEDEGDQNSNFECNICLDVARDAVVSLCGHLFWYVLGGVKQIKL